MKNRDRNSKNSKELRVNKGLGLISDIQRFSVNDGPGIRTTIFMKGCPLACWWCQNPETINSFAELMIRDAKCLLCGHCADICPIGAITISHEDGMMIDRTKCTRCFECVPVCPTNALKKVGAYVSVEELAEKVARDDIFYYQSGGGVTVSGGEPLLQGDFVALLLQACRGRGFHTCLDTSGYAPWKVFEKVLKHVDLVLFDVKHMDCVSHKKGTGQGNSLILSNLRNASTMAKIWLRIPLVPDFNDDQENLERVGRLAKEMDVEKVSILPFHKLGEGKYWQLNQKYRGTQVEDLSFEQVLETKKCLEEMGLNVAIGE